MKSPRTDGLTWHGPWDFLEVGPFRIAAPLVYSAPGSRVKEPSAVLMDVPLHTLNRPAGHGSARRHQIRAFYRSYEAMGAPDRWEYLDWLAHGRPAGAPHCFFYLHLQGLEKRVLGDHEDLEPIWNELWRVAETNSRDEFTLQYEVRNCLWYLMASSPHIVPEEHVRELSRMLRPINPYDDNEALRRLSLVVWWCATRLKRLPAWLAYHVARTSAETRHTAVSYRTGLEVEQLFASRVPEILGAAAPID